MNLRKLSLYTLIGSTAVSALIGIFVILFGDFGKLEGQVLATTLTITATSILGLACGAYLELGKGRMMPLIGIALSVLTALCTFLMIWEIVEASENFLKAAGTLAILAVSCSHLSLLGLAKLDQRFLWSYRLAFVCVGLLTAIVLYLIWFEPDVDGEFLPRLIGILSILIASATVITPVFHYLSIHETDVKTIDAEIEKLREKIADLEEKRAELTVTETSDIPSESLSEDQPPTDNL